MPELNLTEWNQWITSHPEAHLLQHGAWGALKAQFGWKPVRVVAGDSGAQILFRQLPLGFSLGYIPKGPVGTDWEALWPEIDAVCKKHRAVFLKLEVDAWEEEFDAKMRLAPAGFQPSAHNLQPPRTAIIDISLEEDEILAGMKQKTRYNIRLASRKEVEVHPSDDLDVFTDLMAVTGERDDFGVHTPEYYRQAYQLFYPLGMCELFIATFEGQPLAGIMVFASKTRAWYFYGASNNLERNRMPAYLVQWEAIRWAKEQGCTSYDLWGVPDADPESLEADFMQQSDGLWGVYRFKRGFGAEIKRAVNSWDKVYIRTAYLGYRMLIARKGGE